ncbi:MAG TPA: 16S rRNA (guanine(966)-N(2))-methyltransferase RsmD [Candidatus Limnocylindria bacterium]|nr:16S rRNA (guanine(966)-N(2))-methyltransferase RsmD [Candidatus Limnocylindria bacterium]
MGLRVIAGAARGRRLVAPRGLATRPTSGLVRGALFNMLAHRGWLEEATLLDLFAGSGSLGIEALSRGAAHVIFVDEAAAAQRVLRRNLERSGFAERAEVLGTSVPSALRRLAARGVVVDGVLVDPPYARGWVRRTLTLLATSPVLARSGWVALEHTTAEPLGATPGFVVVAERRHGRANIVLLGREEPSP